jgi:hypothetical protein
MSKTYRQRDTHENRNSDNRAKWQERRDACKFKRSFVHACLHPKAPQVDPDLLTQALEFETAH